MSSCKMSFSTLTLNICPYLTTPLMHSSHTGRGLQNNLPVALAGSCTWCSQRNLGTGPIVICFVWTLRDRRLFHEGQLHLLTQILDGKAPTTL